MSEQYKCNKCGEIIDIAEMQCSECGNGRLKLLRWRKGGDGSHWEGCAEAHWDCKIAQLEKEIERLNGIIARLKEDGDNLYMALDLSGATKKWAIEKHRALMALMKELE